MGGGGENNARRHLSCVPISLPELCAAAAASLCLICGDTCKTATFWNRITQGVGAGNMRTGEIEFPSRSSEWTP